MKKGLVFMDFVQEMTDLILKNESDPQLGPAFKKLASPRDKLTQSMMQLGALSMSGDVPNPVLNASPFLMAFGDVVIGYMLLRHARVALDALNAVSREAGGDAEATRFRLIDEHQDAACYSGKIAAARLFAFNVLPKVDAAAKAIMAGDPSALTIADSAL